MPGSTTTEIKCVKCKTLFETEVIDHIDLSEDGDLIRNLRTGKANRVQCTKCKKVMYLDRSIVINFEPQSLIVIYDPKAKTKKSKDEWLEEYQSVIAFNEILTELSEETEFKVISKLDELKSLLTAYVKTVG